MIRIFTMEDYDQVYALWIRTPGVRLRNLDDSREGLSRFLQRNPNTNFVAEEDGRIIGVALSGHDGRRGYLYHTCVSEEHRRRSLGRELVERVVESMISENIAKLALLCIKDNEKGNGFWNRLGWSKRSDVNYYSIDIIDNNF